MRSTRCVVIVGAGVAGVATVVHLARCGRADVGTVTLVDVNPPGHGVAFGSRDADLLCNTSADTCSLVADEPDDFIIWLRARGIRVDAAAFVPRMLVARYAFERFSAARLVLRRHGTRLTQVRALTRAVTGTPGHYVVHTDAGGLPATDVVICAGATTPIVPDPLAPYVGAESLTIGPYPIDQLITGVGPVSRVLVIGTRLSAIDAALVLIREGHHVTLTSRSGLLPAVRSRFGQPALPLPTRTRLAVLSADNPGLATHLMRIGVQHLSAHDALPLRHHLSTARHGMTRLREETRLAAAGRSLWQELGFELATGLNDATWVSKLAPRTRATLDRRFTTYFTRYLTAMPLINAEKLIGYHDLGRFTVAPAFPTSISPTRKGWRVKGIDPEPQTFEHIVAAAGYSAPHLAVTSRPTDPISLSLLTSPPTATSAHTIDSCLRLRKHEHTTSERIWLVGLTVRQHLFAPQFLPTVVTMAARVTACLTSQSGTVTARGSHDRHYRG